MSIRIQNSLTKQKEEFIPLNGKTVKMYSCGVTVYDRCHIGHARSLYIFDVIRRYLKFRGYDVHFVRNITDVDDKIIHKAIELGRPSREVSEDNIAMYYEDLESMGIDPADIEPKATDNIEDMIIHIQGLIDKDMAYAVDGNVYFRVRAFKGYGKLSGQSVEKMEEAVRIEKDAHKQDPLDFALWKSSKQGEPSWDSPWGPGRPGWHIECSCMSMKHLNTQTLDIHAGGRDLVFPHHENEIAQSEAYTGKPFAKYWIHHGLLTINSQKMAKSLGNFITIQDALKKFTVDDLKMFFLSAHYSSAIDYTEAKMEDMHKALQKFDILFWKAEDILAKHNFDGSRRNGTSKVDWVEQHRTRFIEAMDDDFNTALAIGSLFDLINDTNRYIDTHTDDADFALIVYTAVDVLETLSRDIFGLFRKEESKELADEDAALLDQRKEARANKDFKRSDELRDQLKDRGIIVEDTKEGQSWRWA